MKQPQETPHGAVLKKKKPAYYVISVVIYSVFKLLLFLFIGSEEHGVSCLF